MATLRLKTSSDRMERLNRGKVRRERERLDAVTWKWLCKNYKPLFAAHAPKPLAIGIHCDLAHVRPEGIGWKSIRRVLARWCNRKLYLRAIVAGGPRYGLNGEAGEVTPDQQQDAAEKLRTQKQRANG